MQITSILNKNINDEIKYTNELEEVVLNIFKESGEALTTNEMLDVFYKYVNTYDDNSIKNKIILAARNNGLKAARTKLTHRGLLMEIHEKKDCRITRRSVNAFIYSGTELSEKEQILNEIKRREDDINRCVKKIQELKDKLADLP